LKDINDEINAYKKLVEDKKTFLISPIKNLIKEYDSFTFISNTLRKSILTHLDGLEQKHLDHHEERRAEAKRSHHEGLIKERNSELENIEKKKEEIKQAGITREKIKSFFGFKPKKHKDHFQIQEAVKKIKESEDSFEQDLSFPEDLIDLDEPITNQNIENKKHFTMPDVNLDTQKQDELENLLPEIKIKKGRKTKKQATPSAPPVLPEKSEIHESLPLTVEPTELDLG